MQMKIDVIEMPLVEYFSMTSDFILDGGRSDSINVFWVKVPNTGFRLTLLVPPNGYSWGMQFRHPGNIIDWMENVITDSVVAEEYRRMFDTMAIDPAYVPETLAGCGTFGESRELEVGTAEPDLPRAWFRSVFIPDAQEAFEKFLLRLRDHIDQLGRFFLLPQPKLDGVALVNWSESVDGNLETLFGSDHNPKISAPSDLFARRKNALDNAINTITSAEAQTWLTPRFLDWDLLRPSYPLVDTPLKTKRTEPWLSIFSLRPVENLLNEKKTLSLLRVQLMRKWKWPVGIKMLAKHHEWQEYRKTILRGAQPWQPLEAEVFEVLNQARNIYPILFN
jgi:hypothetical protein